MHVAGEKGQALLIVVLVMVVALTVALSVASRSVTNLRIATEQENSQAAFSAAEAGIEQILKSGITRAPNQELGSENNRAYIKEATVQQVGGEEFVLNNGSNVLKDDGIDVWLVGHNADGSFNFNSGWQLLSGEKKLTVYWGTPSVDVCSIGAATNTMAAIEVIVMSGDRVLPVMTRYTADPCDARRSVNSFSSVDGVSSFSRGGKDFAYRKEIRIDNNSKGIVVRIIPLYASTPIAVKGCDLHGNNCNNFPYQGKVINSTGTSGETARKITYYQGYPKLPPEFFYLIFSSQK